MNEILEAYGIDPSTGVKSNVPKERQIVTVGQLEDAIKSLQAEPKETQVIMNQGTMPNDPSIIVPDATPVFGTIRLTRTTNYDYAYGLVHTVDADYVYDLFSGYEAWDGVHNPNVRLEDYGQFGTSYDLGDIEELSASYTSSRVTVHSVVVVDMYVAIGEIKFYYGSNRVESNEYWYSDLIPN